MTLVRTVRKQQGLTLEAVAANTGLTKSYLSKVERGISMPSIAVALKISRALDVDVSELFTEGSEARRVSIFRHPEAGTDLTGVGYRPLAANILGKTMVPFISRPPADYSPEYHDHAGNEFVIVHRGSIGLDVAGRECFLSTGDAAYFDGTVPHRMCARSVETEVFIIVESTPGGDVEHRLHR